MQYFNISFKNDSLSVKHDVVAVQSAHKEANERVEVEKECMIITS